MINNPIDSALYRVKRGLAGYVSYLAACDMNSSFSEYLLYEPTLRILSAQGWQVRCEHPCPGYPSHGRGDHKKIDFVCTSNQQSFAIEMKWARQSRLDVTNDLVKLHKYIEAQPTSRAFLCIFGRKSDIESLNLGVQRPKESGKAVYAEFGVTRFGCRNYEVSPHSQSNLLHPQVQPNPARLASRGQV